MCFALYLFKMSIVEKIAIQQDFSICKPETLKKRIQ